MIEPQSIKMCEPSITEHEINMVTKMMRDGWESYQYVEEFEQRFATIAWCRYCLMTTCCTLIHLGLMGLI